MKWTFRLSPRPFPVFLCLVLVALVGLLLNPRPDSARAEVTGSVPGRTLGIAAPNQLWFPFLMGDATSFTGFAVSNHGLLDAQLSFEALAGNGDLQDYPKNPAQILLPSGQQLAKTASEIFGLAVSEPRSGWVRLESDRADLASFFQFGRVGEDGNVEELDGAVAVRELSTVLYFTRVFDGPLAFPSFEGGEDADETLYLANPNSKAVQVTLEIFDVAGIPQGMQLRNLAAGGCLSETVSSLFHLGPIGDGFIRVTSNSLGIVGFETISLDGTILGLNAVPASTGLKLYSAQLAHGQSGDDRIFTSLKLINTTDGPISLVLTAIGDDGNVINVLSNLILGGRQTLQRDVGEIFNLGPATGDQVDGSIRVEATGPGILGDVIFGDPDAGRYAASLALQTQLFTRAIFSQVANLNVGNERQRFFTGLAFHNPQSQQAAITIRVFTEFGRETGSKVIQLAPGARFSDLLSNLIPETEGQVRGYIVVESTRPIVAQQLFGNYALDFLSAVPPTVLQD